MVDITPVQVKTKTCIEICFLIWGPKGGFLHGALERRKFYCAAWSPELNYLLEALTKTLMAGQMGPWSPKARFPVLVNRTLHF